MKRHVTAHVNISSKKKNQLRNNLKGLTQLSIRFELR